FDYERCIADTRLLASDSSAPAWCRDGAGVDRLNGRLQQVNALEEEGALFRNEQGEPFVRGDLRDVRLHLREVRLDREIDGGVRIRRHLDIDAAVLPHGVADQRRSESGRWSGRGGGADVRRRNQVTAAWQPLQALE